ncbi:unnamed protein product [Arctogadus glacialis]
MRALGLLLLCVFGSTLVSLTVANYGALPNSCCFRYYEKQVKFDKVRSYDWTDGRCSNPAVILRTIANVRICVNPEATWVNNLMERLDKINLPRRG